MTRPTVFMSRATHGIANTRSRIGWSDFYMTHRRRALLVWIGSRTFMLSYPSRNYARATRTRHIVAR